MTLPPGFGPVEWLLLAISTVVVNTIPVFMPPTWTLLAWAHLGEGVPVLPLALVGAAGATTGRFLLARASRLFGDRLLPRRWKENTTALVNTIRSHKLGISTVVVLPTNQLFIAVGLAGAPLFALLAAFGVTRFVSYVVWVVVADTAVSTLGDALHPTLGNNATVVAQLFSFVMLLVVMQIDWGKHLRRFAPPKTAPTTRDEAHDRR